MQNSNQYANILRVCRETSDQIKKLKTDVHNLQSIQATNTAELHMLIERFDLFTNQEFFKENIDRRDALEKSVLGEFFSLQKKGEISK